MLAAGSRVDDEWKNEQVNGKCRRVSRLSKSVETSCVVRSEHRAAKGGMIAGGGNGARRVKGGRKPEEEGHDNTATLQIEKPACPRRHR